MFAQVDWSVSAVDNPALGVVHRVGLLNRGTLMKSSYVATMSLPIVAYALFLVNCTAATAQTLYWSQSFPGPGPGGNLTAEGIRRSDVDGNGISTIVPASAGLGFVHSIKYEPSSNKLYWTDQDLGLIQKSNLDGSNVQTVVKSLFFGQTSSVRGLAIDPAHSAMYWTDEDYQTVSRANLDGSGTINVITGILSGDVAIDVPAGSLFFANNVAGPEGPYDAIDISNLNGTSHHTIVNGIYQLTGLDVDPVAQKIYWADVGLNRQNDTSIRRANYDGSGMQILLSNLPDVIRDLDVVPELNAMFWSSRDQGMIKRADLNGANLHTIVSGLSQPGAVHVVVPEASSEALLVFGLLLCSACNTRRVLGART